MSDKKLGTPRGGGEEGKKTPRDRAKLMTGLQKLGQSRLVFARNMWTYTLSLRYISTYLVRFGESQSLLSSSRDPILFRSLHPLLNPRFLFPIANVKEEQPPSSFAQLNAFLDAVISPELAISKKSFALARLQAVEDQLKARFDKALPKGFEGLEAAAKEPMPSSVKKPDWQLANALFLADLVGKLFSAILPQCNTSSCPDMNIAEDAFYMWKDDVLTGGIVLPASEYARSVIRMVGAWVKEKNIEKLPEKSNKDEYATTVRRFCATLFTKMAHLIAHIKYEHLVKEEGGGKTKSSPAITKSGKKPSKKEEIRVTRRVKGASAQDEFAHQIKKVQGTPRKTTLTSSANVPVILVELTTFLLKEDVEINVSKAVELEEKDPNLAKSLVLDFKKGQDLTTHKPEVIVGAVAAFLDQMKTPIILPDYVECFEVALTMPTVDIRIACVEKTISLIRGLAKEVLCFIFSFFHSLVQDKKIDTYQICSFFGSKIVRQPMGKVSESLSTAVTHLILTNFPRFFPQAQDPNSALGVASRKYSRISPRDPARKKKSRGSLGKFIEKSEKEDEDAAQEEQEEKSGSFGTFVVKDIEVDIAEQQQDNNNFGTFVMKDAVDDDNNFGTFVMKDAGGGDDGNFGTFVMKDAGGGGGDDGNFGTFVMKDADSGGDNSNNFGTFVMNEGASSETVKITEIPTATPTPRKAHAVLDNYIQQANPEQPVRRSYLGGGSAIAGRCGGKGKGKGGGGLYREPEKWEKNLVSLTKGDLEEMEDSAFHRYTKKRGGLQAMDWSTSASAEEKNEEIEKALDGEEAKKIKKFANLWKRTSMLSDVEQFSQELKNASVSK